MPTAADTPAPLAAVTGATGFIGRHLVVALAQSGWRLRLLLRRHPAIREWRDVRPEIVPGSLGDPTALERLVDGAGAVIHVAGLIKAASRRRFFEVNRDGARALAEITREVSPQAHFVLVSSLAAREPALSDYAASKRAGEDAVREAMGERSTVLRPPAVYGPGDRETLLFFRLARRRIVPLLGPAHARAALIHVRDLARLIVCVAASAPRGQILCAADGQPQGYGWAELLGTAARAVGNPAPRLVHIPRALLRAFALAGDVGQLFGSATLLDSQKLRELWHPNWSVASHERAQPAGWAPELTLQSGFAETVEWYRAAGWLPASGCPEQGASPL